MRPIFIAFLMPLILAANVASATQRLPDTEITQYQGTAAWLTDPVKRYQHGILGDAVEAGGFQVQFHGKLYDYTLGDDAVFEDRRVRLADLTGDGTPEAIVVKSYLKKGSAIAVYKLSDKGIEPLAESEPVGTANRWLNPLGVIANPGEDKVIAAVIMPHVSGSVRTFKLSGKTLKQVDKLDGYTNHIIHTPDLDLGRLADVDDDGRDDIVLPDMTLKYLAVLSVDSGKLKLKIKLPAGGTIVGFDRINRGVARVRLSNGRRVAIKLRS